MEIFTIILSLTVCSLLGLTIGFFEIADVDVKKGIKPVTENRFILLLAKSKKEYKGFHIIWFAVFMLLWLLIFFGSLMACGILLSKYAPSLLTHVYFLFPFFFIGIFVGVKAWKKMPKTEA